MPSPIDAKARDAVAAEALKDLRAEEAPAASGEQPAPLPFPGRTPEQLLPDAKAVVGCILTVVDRVASAVLKLERHPDVVDGLTEEFSPAAAELAVPLDGVKVLGVSVVRIAGIVAKLVRERLTKPSATPPPSSVPSITGTVG